MYSIRAFLESFHGDYEEHAQRPAYLPALTLGAAILILALPIDVSPHSACPFETSLSPKTAGNTPLGMVRVK